MIIAVDTGGTKTLVASFNKTSSLPLETVRFLTPSEKTDYVEATVQAIKQLAGERIVDAIAIAMPGTVVNGTVTWFGNLRWQPFAVEAAFAPYFPGIPILVENDANLGGLGEVRLRRPHLSSALYVTISTGIGTGAITEGRINPNLRHSEGGQIMLEYNGKLRRWESFASGHAIYDYYGKYARDITSVRAWRHIADRMSRGFLALIPVLQPDIIIIGGSIGSTFKSYGPRLQQILHEKLPPEFPCPRFVAAAHPEEAVIYGCYFYALDYLAD